MGYAAIIILILIVIVIWIDPEKKTLDDVFRRKLGKNYISLPDGIVHYELEGPESAPTIVLVHGFSVPSYIWDPTFFALVQAGFRVLRFDLYGRGFSDRPRAVYTINFFVDQLAALLDALELKTPVHLVGLSMGGPISAAFSRKFPEKVRSVTLIDPLVSPFSKIKILPLLLHGMGELVMAVYGEPIMLPKAQEGDLCEPGKFPDYVEKFKEQIQYKGFRRAILSTLRNLTKINTHPDYQALNDLGIPSILFRGSEDRTIPAKDMDVLCQLVPTIEFHQIEGTGHIPHYEKPDVVNPILLDFFGKN